MGNSNLEFDYLFRTNTSSFVDFNKLQKYSKSNHNNLDYSGVVLDVVEGDTIASGAGFFLSRKNVELILKNKDKFDETLPDDVAIARLLRKFEILPSTLIRKDLKKFLNLIQFIKVNTFITAVDLIHNIIESRTTTLKYLNRASEKNGLVTLLYYYFLVVIFEISNIKVVRIIIQKFYSYRFYGEINIGDKIVF